MSESVARRRLVRGALVLLLVALAAGGVIVLRQQARHLGLGRVKDGPVADSSQVDRVSRERAASGAIGMLAAGGVVVVLILAIGGVVGRAYLERDAA